jgi:multidrug efflux pump subunit AcrA (membrane-fusion protein)
MSRNCVRLRRTTGKPNPIWCATRNWSTREKSLYPTTTNTFASAGGDEAAVEASRYAAASSEQIVEEKKASLRQQQTKHSEDKANLPRQITIHKATVDSRKANVDSAKAQLDTALLNLSYCHIVAPVDGDREPAQRGNRDQSFARAATHRGGPD